MSNEIRQREPIYDLLKGVGIILVVLGHITLDLQLANVIYSFHMPLFFFVSGMLYRTKEKFIVKQAKGLLVPYVLFSVLSFVYWCFVELRFREKREGTTVLEQFINIFYPMNMEGCYEFNIVLWFLPCLFVTSVLYHVVKKNMKSQYTDAILLIITIIIAQFLVIKIPFFISESMFALPFFVAGRLFSGEKEKNNSCIFHKNNYGVLIGLFVAVIAIGYVLLTGIRNDMLCGIYSKGYLSFFVCAICIIYSLYVCLSKVKKVTALQWMGMNSLGIMLVHEPVKRIVVKLYSVVVSEPVNFVRESYTHTFIILIIIVCLSSGITCLINKYAKFAFGKF